MNGSLRWKLLAGACAAGMASPALADNGRNVEYFGSIEGSMLFSEIGDFSSGYNYETPNDREGETDLGWGTRAEIGMRVGDWIFTLGGGYQRTQGSETAVQNGSGNTYFYDDTARYLAVDFMVGQEFGLGWASVRPMAGIRAANVAFETVIDNPYNNGNSFCFYDLESETWAFGPRVGASANVPLGGGFAVDASAYGFVLFGSQDRTDLYNCGGSGTTYQDDEGKTLFGAEGSLGVTYGFALSDLTQGAITIGYRIDYIHDAIEGEQTLYEANLADPPYRPGAEEDYLTHGVFVKFSVNY